MLPFLTCHAGSVWATRCGVDLCNSYSGSSSKLHSFCTRQVPLQVLGHCRCCSCLKSAVAVKQVGSKPSPFIAGPTYIFSYLNGWITAGSRVICIEETLFMSNSSFTLCPSALVSGSGRVYSGVSL